uniref:Uncharacterized protein n=1 Tax=Setaria italica TaxID=4555 RepID=K4API6_SETIT
MGRGQHLLRVLELAQPLVVFNFMAGGRILQ